MIVDLKNKTITLQENNRILKIGDESWFKFGSANFFGTIEDIFEDSEDMSSPIPRIVVNAKFGGEQGRIIMDLRSVSLKIK